MIIKKKNFIKGETYSVLMTYIQVQDIMGLTFLANNLEDKTFACYTISIKAGFTTFFFNCDKLLTKNDNRMKLQYINPEKYGTYIISMKPAFSDG